MKKTFDVIMRVDFDTTVLYLGIVEAFAVFIMWILGVEPFTGIFVAVCIAAPLMVWWQVVTVHDMIRGIKMHKTQQNLNVRFVVGK